MRDLVKNIGCMGNTSLYKEERLIWGIEDGSDKQTVVRFSPDASDDQIMSPETVTGRRSLSSVKSEEELKNIARDGGILVGVGGREYFPVLKHDGGIIFLAEQDGKKFELDLADLGSEPEAVENINGIAKDIEKAVSEMSQTPNVMRNLGMEKEVEKDLTIDLAGQQRAMSLVWELAKSKPWFDVDGKIYLLEIDDVEKIIVRKIGGSNKFPIESDTILDFLIMHSVQDLEHADGLFDGSKFTNYLRDLIRGKDLEKDRNIMYELLRGKDNVPEVEEKFRDYITQEEYEKLTDFGEEEA